MKTERKLKLVASRPKTYGSQRFLNLTRNTDLESPTKFVPTVKGPDDVVI